MKCMVSRNFEVRASQSPCDSVGVRPSESLVFFGWLQLFVFLFTASSCHKAFAVVFYLTLCQRNLIFIWPLNATINCCCWNDLTCLCQPVSKQESLQPFCSPFM